MEFLFCLSLSFQVKKVALIAALLYALSPFTFFFDGWPWSDAINVYYVWTFQLLLILLFTTQPFRLRDVSWICFGWCLANKIYSIIFCTNATNLGLLIFSKKFNNFYFLLTLITIVIGYGMYNILRLGPNFELVGQRNLDYVWPISHVLSYRLLTL